MSAVQEIESAYQDALVAGVPLGAQTSPVIPAHSGGMVQHVNGGDVYWHPSRGAFEVHGGILREYLRLGGPGEDFAGVRVLGYPTSSETRCWDGRFLRSSFEFGAVYWGIGAGAVTVTGDWWGHYPLPREGGPLGLPITSPVAVHDAEVQFFEEGCLVRRSGAMFTCRRNLWPRIGRPHLLAPGGAIPSPVRDRKRAGADEFARCRNPCAQTAIQPCDRGFVGRAAGAQTRRRRRHDPAADGEPSGHHFGCDPAAHRRHAGASAR